MRSFIGGLSSTSVNLTIGNAKRIQAGLQKKPMSFLKALSALCLFFLVGSVFAGELPTPNKFGGDFRFDSTLGKKSSISDWKGRVVLLNFGFTSCPDICPLVLSKLTLVKNSVDEKDKHLQVVFVSVDPKRDSIEKISSYLKNFHPSFVGMRSLDEYKKVLRSYGASAQHNQVDGHQEVSHTDYVYLINREGYVAGFYDIKSDYKTLLEAVKKAL